MSHFAKAIPFVLANEGGFINHANDPGGATNYGISLRFLKAIGDFDDDGWLDGDLDHDGDVDVDDIRNMTEHEAIEFYLRRFWRPNKYQRINSQHVATKVLDLTVNMGSRQSHKLLQRALRACGKEVVEDGLLGNKTFAAVNAANEECLLTSLRSEAAGFYRILVALKPEERMPFKRGWLNRAYH